MCVVFNLYLFEFFFIQKVYEKLICDEYVWNVQDEILIIDKFIGWKKKKKLENSKISKIYCIYIKKMF